MYFVGVVYDMVPYIGTGYRIYIAQVFHLGAILVIDLPYREHNLYD